MPRPQSLLVLVALAFVAIGCPKNIPPPDDGLETPAELRAAIDERTAQIETARFKEVVVDYFGEGDRVKVRQLILVKQPSFLRVQTRAPGSEEILSLLVSDGATFSMHRRDTNEFFTGRASSENIARLLPVDLSAIDVTRVMLGGAPWDRFERAGGTPSMEWDRKRGEYAYRVKTKAGGELVMWVRHTDFAVVRIRQFDDREKVIYRYETDDWERHQTSALPAWRRFVWPERNLDFSMDVRETQVDVELPQSLFELQPPAGSEIITVDR